MSLLLIRFSLIYLNVYGKGDVFESLYVLTVCGTDTVNHQLTSSYVILILCLLTLGNIVPL